MFKKQKNFIILIAFVIIMFLLLFSHKVSAAQVSGLTSNEIYTLTNVSSGKCLNVNYGTDANGTNLTQYTNDGSIEQRFRLVYNSSKDAYRFYTMCSSNGTNRVLDVLRTGGSASGSIVSGNNIDIWLPNDDAAQYWKIINRGNGYYSVQLNSNQNLALTVVGTGNGSGAGTSSTSNGNAIVQTYTGASTQLWKIQPMAIVYYSNSSPSASLTTQYVTNLGYNCKELRGYSNQQFLQDLKSTKILTYSGHGDAGVLTFDNGSYIYGSYSSNTANSISSLSSGSITDRLFITFSCYGGTSNSSRGNIVNEVYNKGANVAIGFTTEITMGHAEAWSYKLFSYLSEGNSLSSAMTKADSFVSNYFNSDGGCASSSYRYVRGNTNIYF